MRLVAFSFAVAVGLASTVAFAGGQVRVDLIDGSTVVGELVENVPRDKVVLRLATGEIRVIPYTVILPHPAAPPPPPPPPPPAPEPMFHVEVQGDRPGVTLMRLSGAGVTDRYFGGWQGSSRYAVFTMFTPVCRAPCAVDVPSSSIYRIGGDGVTPSRNFSLPGNGARLDVSAGSMGARIGGFVSLGLGIGALIAGGTLALFGALENTYPTNYGVVGSLSAKNDTAPIFIAAGVTAGIGAVLIALGIFAIATSGTSVRQSDGVPVEYVGQGPKVRWAGDRLVF